MEMSRHPNYKGLTAQVNMTMTPEMKRRLGKIAWDRDTSISAMIRELIVREWGEG